MSKTMNRFLVLLSSLLLFGCDVSVSHQSSPMSYEPRVRCVDGVVYYHGARMLAVAYHRDGSIKLCDMEKKRAES